MNDKKLHETFVQIGRERNKLTYRLLSLLPKIFNKQIYKKKGYETIYEYAGKLAGLSKSVVEKTLRVEKHIADKPTLKQSIIKVGIHKVALVAGLATQQNEAQWADKAENMSKAALSEFTKEVRSKQKLVPGDGNKFGDKPIPGDEPPKKVTRYIPAAQKRIIIQKTSGRCAYPNCNRPLDAVHHKERFSTNKNHKSITPTCKIHHEFAHNGLINNEKSASQQWKLGFGQLHPADIYYRKYRRQEAVKL